MPRARWIKDPLSFTAIRDRIESRDDCEYEEREVGADRKGGRFKRSIGGRLRTTAPFAVGKYDQIIDPGTVASWAKALDIDCNELGVDEG